MKKHERNERSERNKTLFIELSPTEHGVLRVESALSGQTLGDIIRERVIEPLMAKHGAFFGKAGESNEAGR